MKHSSYSSAPNDARNEAQNNAQNGSVKTGVNPIINSDFPDPDIIRVGDTYYLCSTTMHYMPGCDILRSYDLVNWEFLSHAYDTLENNPAHRLEGDAQVYGQGMWAPSFNYHAGRFYVNFTANDTHKTYLLVAEDPAGPWEKREMAGFYYDSSLFFDDDGRVYIVHGQKNAFITELLPDLSGPKPGGLSRQVLKDSDNVNLGYEGHHLYRKDGLYYWFTCHMPRSGNFWKTEDCFISDSLEGEFRGGCVIDDDMGYRRLGVAQGGMIDTPEGDWYMFMFQDRGALGRSPMLMPLSFDETGFPVPYTTENSVPREVSVKSTRPDHVYAPLNGDDDFNYVPDENGRIALAPFWQWNHDPDPRYFSFTERPGAYRMYSGKRCASLTRSLNTLTQRSVGPKSAGAVTLDASGLKDGDYAGIAAFLGCYAAVAVTRECGRFYLVALEKTALNETVFPDKDYLDPARETERILLDSPIVTLRVESDFTGAVDYSQCFYKKGEDFLPIGRPVAQYFKMDHFTGLRFGLFLFSEKETGGYADFMRFRFEKLA